MSPPADPDRNDPRGRLYIVATPIGNRDDITLRAIKILTAVDLVAAEDTRHTGRLLAHHGIRNQLVSYHEHNEAQMAPKLIERLAGGQSLALVSDAGTPGVSDPGYRLIRAAAAEGCVISPIPGASAPIAALSAAGLPTDQFTFLGFGPQKAARRRRWLAKGAAAGGTLIFYESARRLPALIAMLRETLGDRPAVLAREMTKLHEEFLRGSLSAIAAKLDARGTIKGECTLLVDASGQGDVQVDLAQIQAEIASRLAAGDASLTQIARELSQKYGLSRNAVYAEGLKQKERD